MKQTIVRLTCLVLALTMLAGCGGAPTGNTPLDDPSSDAVSDGGSTTTTAGNVSDSTTVGNNSSAVTTPAPSGSTTTGTPTTKGETPTTGAPTTKGETPTTKNDSPVTPTTPAPPQKEYVDGLEVVHKIGTAPLAKFDDNLYKLDVPFEDIYTSVFFLKLGEGEWAVIDTATTAGDVNTYIIPAATALGITTAQIKAILLTHDHADHAGGLPTLFPKCANATVYGVSASNSTAGGRYRSVSDGTTLFDGKVKCVTLRGHAAEACGWLDTRSKTIMTGDSIQFYGAGQYGCQLYGGLTHYEASMAKLKTMATNGEVENIIISHRYVPVSSVSVGKANSVEYMDIAIFCYQDLKEFTIEKYQNGTRGAAQIMAAFIGERSRQYQNFPRNYFSNTIQHIINNYC